jgi:hypothetical protein
VSIFHGSTYENKHLNPNYVKNLENSYDELMIKQFLHGQAVNLTVRLQRGPLTGLAMSSLWID